MTGVITIETQLATWFGSADRPLLGFLHVPSSGTVREAVVMCPPLGKEHIDTYRGMRLLGEKLAAQGMAAFRFEYAGVGDSAGAEDDPDALTLWLKSIVSAVDYVRQAGAESVSIVGLRVGALLAASALQECGHVNSIVLWDPILTGRNYLRNNVRSTRSASERTIPPTHVCRSWVACWLPNAPTNCHVSASPDHFSDVHAPFWP